MRKTFSEMREERLEQELQALAGAGDWRGVLQALDEFDANGDRRERNHRANLDVTLADRDPGEGEYCQTAVLLRLSRWEDWEDLIFSRRAEDLYQLTETGPVSTALGSLTPIQRRVLFENVVLGIPAKDIAREMGCSDRNITKHRKTALDKIRFLAAGQMGRRAL